MKRIEQNIRGERSRTASKGKRRGFLSMELVLVLPILMLLMLALLEFGLLFFARAQVVEASRTGARAASFVGPNRAAIEQEVRAVLSPRMQQGLQVSTTGGVRSGEVVSVIVRVPMRNAAPDLLWPIGFSLSGRTLLAETRMMKE
jgi:hypothetical protein